MPMGTDGDRTTGCNDWFYDGATGEPSYRLKLFFRYYLPKYLTIWKPVLNGPAIRKADFSMYFVQLRIVLHLHHIQTV